MIPDYSIIIPAYNEERYIGQVLSTILDLTSKLSCEVVVVDNGSTDSTQDIINDYKVEALKLVNAPIAAVRNYGARNSSGKVLIFIDADVVITPSWCAALLNVSSQLHANPLQVLGARCHAPAEGFLNRYWFNRLREYSASYINSGNLLTSRILFEKLDGFDQTLTTAEDYDFCQRARRAGAKVIELPQLVTIHLGYPNTITGFIRRERWHGIQDFISFSSIRESRVAWLALTNLTVLMICVIVTVLTLESTWPLLYLIFLAGLSAASTAKRFGFSQPTKFFMTSGVFALYLCGRSLAAVDGILKR